MSVISKVLLLTVALLGLAPLLSAQADTPSIPLQKPPQVKLEVILAKKTYRVGEAVTVKYKLTNLTEGTVCFPRPNTKIEEETEGYFRTRATNIEGERENFLEGFYPRGMTDQELLNQANENWIKVAPRLSYISEEAHPVGSLDAGDWKVQSRYIPPDLRGRAGLIEGALGCTPPEVTVTSKLVKVSIMTDAPNH